MEEAAAGERQGFTREMDLETHPLIHLNRHLALQHLLLFQVGLQLRHGVQSLRSIAKACRQNNRPLHAVRDFCSVKHDTEELTLAVCSATWMLALQSGISCAQETWDNIMEWPALRCAARCWLDTKALMRPRAAVAGKLCVAKHERLTGK